MGFETERYRGRPCEVKLFETSLWDLKRVSPRKGGKYDGWFETSLWDLKREVAGEGIDDGIQFETSLWDLKLLRIGLT